MFAINSKNNTGPLSVYPVDMRDEEIVRLRPEVEPLQVSVDKEAFQNEVLRPIVKFQAPTIAALYRAYLIKMKVNLNELTVTDFKASVRRDLTKNRSLSDAMAGLIMGLMTKAELNYYLAHRKEIGKRLVSIISQRLIDQFYLVFP